jgi:hypothetical protein
LTSHEVVVNTIGATRTRTGPTIHAELDPGAYPTGVTVPDEVMSRLPLTEHDWHPTWNYTLRPEPLAPAEPAPTPEFGRFPTGDKAPAWLSHPSLTGMEAHALDALIKRYTQYVTEHPPILMPGLHHSGAGSRLLSAADRLLVHVLIKRWSMPQQPLATVLDVSAARIGAATREVTAALAELQATIPAGAIKVTTIGQLAAIAGHDLTK